ncbi:MAG: DUF885 domain-containing protein [Elusimicrobia bacterium CG_4_10_14_0_2_um_filter_63_34]|nr:MAG: DUF885 domain-containing protein [Elusimicrobia bacterium CG_4_10_14_0_2_um_filter_63_34]
MITGLALMMSLFAAGVRAETAGDRLRALLAEEWEYAMRDSPVRASQLGDSRYGALWRDLSEEAFEKRHAHVRELLARLDAFEEAELQPSERDDLRLFRAEVRDQEQDLRYGLHLLPVNQRGGLQTLDYLTDVLPFETVRDYEDWIARMRAFPRLVDQTIHLMRAGVRRGIVHPQVVLERIPEQIDAQIVSTPEGSLFFKPFTRMPQSWPESERNRLKAEGARAIASEVVPAFKEFRSYFIDRYMGAGSSKIGIWQFPEGREAYASLVRRHTTTTMTPEAIHKLGLGEVKRIRAEMRRVMKETGHRGGLKGFMEFLRTDPRFYYKTSEELLQAYRAIAKRIDPEMVKLFGRLPRIPYGVVPVPDHVAPHTTTAYYRGPSADGKRPGLFYVNLYKPQSRPTYEMEVLTVHEAVPGHHIQIALAMEHRDVPHFRRFGQVTAFVEGWGLYAESLGEEIGLYEDPYSKFGELTYRMWRAVRLVVDTGIHHYGWSREKAIEYFRDNCAKSEVDIVNEIDRYVIMPGQALSYKIGELKITELRRRAERELGEAFDERAFHDEVLGRGAVTLDMLETGIDEWIKRHKG